MTTMGQSPKDRGGPMNAPRIPTFTPTPWDWEATVQFGDTFAGHVYLVDAAGRKIGTLWGKGEEKIANAKLVSRAPRLYEALDLLVDAYRHGELEDSDVDLAERLLSEIVSSQGHPS